MAGLQVKSLLIGLTALLLVSSASAVSFKVQVSDITGYNSVGLDHGVEGSVVNVNTTVRNTGSIGCNYRLSGVFETENGTDQAWSDSKPLFPGASSLLELNHVVYNYSGPVEASIGVSYCGEERDIGNFTFEVNNSEVVNNSVSSSASSVNSSSAVLETEVEEGVLVPDEVPAGWKASSVKVEDGEAVAEFEPTIFHPEREISYFVVGENGEVEGTTTVSLNRSPGLVERIMDNRFKVLLGFSALINLALIFRLRSSILSRLKALK